jgi:hypothetical protein
VVLSTWEALTNNLNESDLKMLTAYRDACRTLEGVTEEVHSKQIQYKDARVFTSAYVKSHWLEIGVDLTEEVSHPLLRTVYPTSKRVFTHRFTLSKASEVRSVMKFIRRARKEVGPGFKPATKPKA